MTKITCIAFTAVAFCFTAYAKITLAPVFTDNMVLQREKPVAVWGSADPQEEVAVSFAGQNVTAKANAAGAWKLQLTALAVSKENRTLTATGKANTLTVKNVLVGEVWLCSGQSNMELPLWNQTPRFRDRNGFLVSQFANYPLIRFARMANYDFSTKPRTDYAMQWEICSPETVKKLSAVSYYYGLTLFQNLNIPVGLITSHWGGTRIEPWTPPCGFESVPSLKGILDSLGNLKERTTPEEKHLHQQPTVLFNRMIYPFVPYTLRGAIWYQGESNRGEGLLYCDKMHALVNGWKKVFENPELKFYFVQLAPFRYGNNPQALPEICEAQQKFAEEEKDAGMAVINDVGNLSDIHPADKEIVGRRLALLALKRDYGRAELKADSPTLKAHTIENGQFVLTFNHASEWYTTGNQPIRNFKVAGADGALVEAKATIKGAQLIVGAENVKEPKQLFYMWNETDEGNLFNEACLPLGAFRIK